MMPTSLEGQTLGKYRVLEPLGRGGMARVYRAYHPQLDRFVAIKVLRSDLVEDEEFLIRFRREARAVAALRHPNIVQVFDSDVEGDVTYIVLELLAGDSLKTRLSDYRVRGEKMPPGEMVRVMLDVLDGLAYAHGEGMVHRDIKPANILLTGRGEAVITDFGIAQIVGTTRHTASGALMGTLNYMAPEQGLESHSDTRSDIYSLGIVLYEMLTQRTPFDADTPLAILMKHLNDPLPLPRQIDPEIPAPFERVVLKALAKQPGGRYQTAKEMKQALVEACQQAGVEIVDRISLPLSFSTQEAPAESVAVFSGSSRERITDVDFAASETDASLGSRLAAATGEEARDLRGVAKEFLGAVGAVAQIGLRKATDVLHNTAEAVKQETTAGRDSAWGAPSSAEAEISEPPDAAAGGPPGDEPEPPEPAAGAGTAEVHEALVDEPLEKKRGKGKGKDRRAKRQRERQERRARTQKQAAGPRSRVGLAIFSALGILVVGNLCMLTGAAPVGYWQIYEIGWPVQIFLLAWGLCLIMYMTSCIWMLIPIGPILGIGVLMTYTSLTGNWEQWAFIWLFEVWIIVGSIWLPIYLARNKGLARSLSRMLAILLSIVSIAGIAAIGLLVGFGSLIALVVG